jgi:ferric-dicitrate binding protein FerR (iron transport regulator)
MGLIFRDLNGDLAEQEQAEFQQWLRLSAWHAAEFARASLLHDRIRSELLASDVVQHAPDREVVGKGKGLDVVAHDLDGRAVVRIRITAPRRRWSIRFVRRVCRS